MGTQNESLKKFIEIQTKKDEIEFSELEEQRKERLDRQKVISESYNNLMNLDRSLFIDKIRGYDLEDRGYSLPEEVCLWLLKEHNINFSVLNSFFRGFDNREIYQKELKEKQLNFAIFMRNIREEMKKKRNEKKQDNLVLKIDRIYSICEKEGLSKINTKALDRICLENGITVLKKDRVLITESVANRLLSNIVKELRLKKISRTPIPKDVKEKIFERDGNKCRVCSAKEYLEIGHKIPVSKGGTNNQRNLITLCRKCNSKIGTSIIIENEKTN